MLNLLMDDENTTGNQPKLRIMHISVEGTQHDQLSYTKCPSPQSASYYPLSSPDLNKNNTLRFLCGLFFLLHFFFYFLVKRTYTAKLSYHITDLHNEALMHSAESFYSNNSSPTNYYFLCLYTCLHFIHIFDS
jgi:hypothetical protein